MVARTDLEFSLDFKKEITYNTKELENYLLNIYKKKYDKYSVYNINILILSIVKESEMYFFIYDDESRAETLRTLCRFASNPELSFTLYNAAVLSQNIDLTK